MVLSFTGGRGGQILERGEFMSDELGGFGKCESPSIHVGKRHVEDKTFKSKQVQNKLLGRVIQAFRGNARRKQGGKKKNSSLEIGN